MNTNTQLTLIIPAFNEEKNITSTITKWQQVFKELNIFSYLIKVYDDGSTDETYKIANTFASEKVQIFRQKNTGHGPTIIKGYYDSLDSEWIVQADADSEIDPKSFLEFWKQRDNLDLIIGKRKSADRTFIRKVITKTVKFLVQVIFTKGISDPNIPFRLMKKELFKKHYQHILKNAFAPNLILAGFFLLDGAKVKEIEVDFYPRKESSVTTTLPSLKTLKILLICLYQLVRAKVKAL